MKQFQERYPVDYDVIVAGGGPAGVAAAVSAARQGAKVALVERYGIPGGNLTAGHVLSRSGRARSRSLYWGSLSLKNLLSSSSEGMKILLIPSLPTKDVPGGDGSTKRAFTHE